MSKIVSTLVLGALAAACGSAMATEYGDVVSRTAVYRKVAVPQQQCFDEQQTYRQAPSGVGAAIGAVTGGVLGNLVGNGAGRVAATGVGAIAGAMVGDQSEANATPPVSTTVRRCEAAASRIEHRLVGYDVVYDYRGQRYEARLPNDPGPRIALNVNVSPVDAAPPPPPRRSYDAPPPVVYDAPPPRYYDAPPPRYYYGPPPAAYGPSFYVRPMINIGIGGGYYHRWR